MLDLRYVVENLDYVKERLSTRSDKFPIDQIENLHSKRLDLLHEGDILKTKKNSVSKEVAQLKKCGKDVSSIISEMQTISQKIKDIDLELSNVEENIKNTLLAIPNLPNKDITIGKDSDDNKEMRKYLLPTKFNFEPKAHWDIGQSLNILDPERAGKITGTRFTVYRGLGSRLERAVYNFMLDTHIENGYTEIIPPYMVNKDSMIGTGQLPKFIEDMYAISGTDYFLIPTAEVPVTNLHRNEILNINDLTISYCAYTACFRAEAGSAGRDTRGLIRQHQFNKVELVKFSKPENSYEELERLTNDAEKILQLLKLPYRVVELCTGDLGFSSAKTYDIEVWMPSYNRYVEISSCSNFENYQARRANIKFRDQNGKLQFVHTLNGSGLAVGRTVAAILENYQNEDGTITVPDVLKKYMNCDIIK